MRQYSALPFGADSRFLTRKQTLDVTAMRKHHQYSDVKTEQGIGFTVESVYFGLDWDQLFLIACCLNWIGDPQE